MKKIASVILSILLVFTVCFQFSSFDGYAQTEKEIVLFHTNDTHSRVEEGKYAGMGFAKISTYIKNEKEKNKNVLVLDAGDTFHGQTIATLVKGESIATLMNKIGYDATVAGNHDFNYGKERLVELDKLTTFPILASNIKKEDGSDLLTPYIIKEVDGIKFGIFGLATPETAYMSHPKHVEGLTFSSPVEESKKMVSQLKDKVDVVVALAHLGLNEKSEFTSEKVAQKVDGIDIIIDGHSHTILENGKMVGNTLIASTGEYDKNLGKITLSFLDNKLSSKKASLITKEDAANVEKNGEIVNLVNTIKDGQKKVLSQVVGKSNIILDGEREHVRKGETNLGNLISDAILDETKADIAIANGGNIRSSIDVGDITKEEVITVLPFGNYIVTKNLTGKQILAALEHGTSSYPELTGGFPHVGGMTYNIDTSKEVGSRVVNVMVNGSPLDLEKTYLVGLNDFLAAGGDNYTMLKDSPIVTQFSSTDEIFMKYLEKVGEVAPTVEGRISVIEKTETPMIELEKAVKVVNTVEAVETEKTNVYVVKSGEVLWKIAEKYKLTWEKLAQMNKLENPNLILPGQQLIVPAN